VVLDHFSLSPLLSAEARLLAKADAARPSHMAAHLLIPPPTSASEWRGGKTRMK
jgi:hypothetical protein